MKIAQRCILSDDFSSMVENKLNRLTEINRRLDGLDRQAVSRWVSGLKCSDAINEKLVRLETERDEIQVQLADWGVDYE